MKITSLAEVEAFLAVVDSKSFSAAARELGIAQSTVSRRLTNLESRLGHQLMLRTTRKVALTDIGISYASELRQILAGLENADARLQKGLRVAEGVLRVTLPTSFGRAFVLPRIARLSAEYPRLRFEVDLSDRYVDLLDGEYDVAIRMSTPEQSGVRYQKIHTFTLTLCASPAYLREHGQPLDVNDLAAHSCLAQRVYAPRISFPITWQGQSSTLLINPRISVSDSTSLRALALAGAGLAVLPNYLIEADLKAGELVEALPGLAFADYEMFAASLRHRDESEKVNVFLNALCS
ncbi:LysR family transcriptional regulator [Pseudomonas sp. Irchel 3E13]|uniref:LysR family transcriptional regulator n=1 Tax=Pseudomonas sp. Irchel 3E13 TaxID=2008975 RepID=UPI000BA31214|nr:LysR family transcriptional regulator [Pseudomonas sp. Irchel 3E13]